MVNRKPKQVQLKWLNQNNILISPFCPRRFQVILVLFSVSLVMRKNTVKSLVLLFAKFDIVNKNGRVVRPWICLSLIPMDLISQNLGLYNVFRGGARLVQVVVYTRVFLVREIPPECLRFGRWWQIQDDEKTTKMKHQKMVGSKFWVLVWFWLVTVILMVMQCGSDEVGLKSSGGCSVMALADQTEKKKTTRLSKTVWFDMGLKNTLLATWEAESLTISYSEKKNKKKKTAWCTLCGPLYRF